MAVSLRAVLWAVLLAGIVWSCEGMRRVDRGYHLRTSAFSNTHRHSSKSAFNRTKILAAEQAQRVADRKGPKRQRIIRFGVIKPGSEESKEIHRRDFEEEVAETPGAGRVRHQARSASRRERSMSVLRGSSTSRAASRKRYSERSGSSGDSESTNETDCKDGSEFDWTRHYGERSYKGLIMKFLDDPKTTTWDIFRVMRMWRNRKDEIAPGGVWTNKNRPKSLVPRYCPYTGKGKRLYTKKEREKLKAPSDLDKVVLSFERQCFSMGIRMMERAVSKGLGDLCEGEVLSRRQIGWIAQYLVDHFKNKPIPPFKPKKGKKEAQRKKDILRLVEKCRAAGQLPEGWVPYWELPGFKEKEEKGRLEGDRRFDASETESASDEAPGAADQQ